MKSIDYAHAKDSYTTIDVVKYFENIYARIFHGQVISGFSPDLMASLQKLYKDYREAIMKADQTYQRLFRTAFYKDLLMLFNAKINETLDLEVVYPPGVHELPSKMKAIFEDGALMSQILGQGWIQYSSLLAFELHKQGPAFSVSLK